MKGYVRKYLVTLIVMLAAACMLTGCGDQSLEEWLEYLKVGFSEEYEDQSLEEGLELLKAGDYESSVEKFRETVDNEENTENVGEAYRGIGIAKWELGQYEEARDAFISALENGTERTATIYNFLGNCEMQLGNAKAALNYYSLGIACEDCSEEILREMRFNEIAAYEQCGEWENAKTKLSKYTADYPEDARATKEAEFFKTQ